MNKNIFTIILFLPLVINYHDEEGPLQYPEPPEGWEEGDCQSLQIQSPIDIPSIKYKSTIIDDGYHATIKLLNYSVINSGNVKFDTHHKWTTEELNIGHIEIELNKTLYKYRLHSFHFHLYSEHRIKNKQYPMEMHIVHKNMNKSDNANENLVIGILFDYNNDIENEFLKNINLAEEKEIKNANILNLINERDTFYYYKGSLTTVPCTENVNWIVFKNIQNMSFEQFDTFQEWIINSDMRHYGVGYGNARGPKRLSGRKIYLENYNYVNNGKKPQKLSEIILLFGVIIIIIIFLSYLYFKKILNFAR